MTNLPDLEQRVSGVNAQLGKAYVTGAKETKSLSLLPMGVESMTRHML